MEGYYVSLEIRYDNGDIQRWDYDGAQFATLPALKRNMTLDFKQPRFDREKVIIRVSGTEKIRSPFEVQLSDETGSDFTKLVFAEIDKRNN